MSVLARLPKTGFWQQIGAPGPSRRWVAPTGSFRHSRWSPGTACATSNDDLAPVSSAQAATVILDAVERGEWRILVGDDAVGLDRRVRANPLAAYEPGFPAMVPGDD